MAVRPRTERKKRPRASPRPSPQGGPSNKQRPADPLRRRRDRPGRSAGGPRGRSDPGADEDRDNRSAPGAVERCAAGQLDFVAEYNPLFGETALGVVQEDPGQGRSASWSGWIDHLRRPGPPGEAYPDRECVRAYRTAPIRRPARRTSVPPSRPARAIPEAGCRKVIMTRTIADRRDDRDLDHARVSKRSTAWISGSSPVRCRHLHGRERRRQIHPHQGAGRASPVAAVQRRPRQERHFGGPADAQLAGISTVYEEVNLCTNLSIGGRPCWVAEEYMDTSASTGRPPIDGHRGVRGWASTTSIHPPPIDHLHRAASKIVAISRAMVADSKVLILDHVLARRQGEIKGLFKVIRNLRDEGVSILFVSHFLR